MGSLSTLLHPQVQILGVSKERCGNRGGLLGEKVLKWGVEPKYEICPYMAISHKELTIDHSLYTGV